MVWTDTDVRKMLKMRENPQYGRPISGGPPRGRANVGVGAGQTAADIGKMPKTRGNHQYGRLTLVFQTHGHDRPQSGE